MDNIKLINQNIEIGLNISVISSDRKKNVSTRTDIRTEQKTMTK